MKNKRNKKTRGKPSKQIKRFKPASVRLIEKRLLAVEQEAEGRYQYHQLRLGSY